MMRTIHLPILALVLLVFAALPRANAQAPFPLAMKAPPQGPANGVVEDRGGAGEVDFRVYYDRMGKVEREELSSNNDGRMDTFYYYKDGILQRVEIDSKGNGKIDIWVYLVDGKYVQRYERDTTGSGKPDVVRNFGVH
jgi:hypothetical protein